MYAEAGVDRDDVTAYMWLNLAGGGADGGPARLAINARVRGARR